MAVINLGDEGLNDGDDIDPFINQHFVSGNEVHIPSGTYQIGDVIGDGGIGGSIANASLIGDGGASSVTLQMQADNVLDPNVIATSGTVTLKGMNFVNKHNANQDGDFHIQADSGATVVLEDVWRMDGQVGGSGSAAIGISSLAGRNHGTMILRACRVGYWPNNGVYFRPGSGSEILVEDCYFENNNIDQLRLGQTATVRNCVFVQDQAPPFFNGTTGRGLRMRYPGSLTVENSDFYYVHDNTAHVIRLADGSGTLTDVVARNDSGNNTVFIDSGAGPYSGSGFQLSGTNSDDGVPASWIECNNNNCTQPRTSPPSSSGGGGGTTDPNGDESWTTDEFRIDGFEGDNASGGSTLAEYSGDTADYTVSQNVAFEGVYGLTCGVDGMEIYSLPGDGLHNYPQAGDTFEYWLQIPSGGRAGMTFGYQSTDPLLNRYRLINEENSMRLVKSENGAGSVLRDITPTFSANTWLRQEIVWTTTSITFRMYNTSGTLLSTATYDPGTTLSFVDGGVGFQGSSGSDYDSARISSTTAHTTTRNEEVGVVSDVTPDRVVGGTQYSREFSEFVKLVK